PGGWWPDAAVPAADTPPAPGIDLSPQPRPGEAARPAGRRTIVDAEVAHLRAGPSAGTAVIASLARGVEVTPLERRGKWVLVRTIDRDGAQRQEGWVYF